MRLWNAATGAPLGTTGTTLNGTVDFVKFSPDGNWIVLAQLRRAHSGRIVNAADGTEMATFTQHGNYLWGAPDAFPSFSTEGTRVLTVPAVGILNLIWTTSARTNRVTERLHDTSITGGRFSPDGQHLATSSMDNTARIWDADTFKAVSEVMRHGSYVNSIEFSPDGQQVVTGARDHTARIWDAWTGRPLSEPVRHDATVVSVQFSSDGQRILSMCEGPGGWVWEVRCGQPLRAVLQHPLPARKAVFSPDGERAATTTRGSAESHPLVCLWDARRAIPLLPPLGSGVWDVQFSRDGRLLLSVGYWGTTTVWDSITGKIIGGPLHDDTANETRSARFSPDGHLVVTAGYGHRIKVWRIATGSLVSELAHQGAAGFAQFSPDGQWVITTSADKTARLWDWHTGKPLTEPLRHDGEVVWADVSADSQRVATISRDKTARIWEARSGKLLHTLPHAEEHYTGNSVQFSPDGRLVVTASGNMAQIWNSHTGHPMTTPLKHDGRVNSVRFSPDGTRLVTACYDGTARIWDVVTGHSVSDPLSHRGRVEYAEFSPDGRWVLTASIDGTARIWEVPALTSSAPPWLADWAEAVAGQRIDERNASQSVPFDELRRLRQSLKQAPDGDEAARWARWFFVENATRTISPASLITVAQLVQQRIGQYTLDSLQQAVRLSPTNGLAQSHLALVTLTNETTPGPRLVASSEWQSRRGLELSPHEPDAWWARAQLCDYLGRLAEALDAMDRAIGLNPTNARFWNSKGLLLEKTNRLEEAQQSYTKAIELSGSWKDPDTLPALAHENRSKLNRRLNRLAEAGVDHLKALNLPQREPGTPATLLNLSLFYNERMDIDVSSGSDHNFTKLPLGRQTLAGGSEFDIRGVIALAPLANSPEKVSGIGIMQKCRKLHFLHVGAGQMNTDGVQVGMYQVHYADGQQEQIPIIYGAHLRDHNLEWDPKDALAKNTKVAWVGDTPAKSRIRLFETTWENERPDVAIETLDFISRRTGTAPILFAITAEP